LDRSRGVVRAGVGRGASGLPRVWPDPRSLPLDLHGGVLVQCLLCSRGTAPSPDMGEAIAVSRVCYKLQLPPSSSSGGSKASDVLVPPTRWSWCLYGGSSELQPLPLQRGGGRSYTSGFKGLSFQLSCHCWRSLGRSSRAAQCPLLSPLAYLAITEVVVGSWL
jgi:hypothetical protein